MYAGGRVLQQVVIVHVQHADMRLVEQPVLDLRQVFLEILRHGLIVGDLAVLAAVDQHFALRGQHFGDSPAHKDHPVGEALFLGVLGGQVHQQGRDHLDGFSPSLGHPIEIARPEFFHPF